MRLNKNVHIIKHVKGFAFTALTVGSQEEHPACKLRDELLAWLSV